MADINFNRQAFVSPATQPPKPSPGRIGVFILVLALAASGVVGYKLILESTSDASKGDSQNLSQIQKQLAEVERRVEQLEKRRNASTSSTARSPLNDKPVETSETVWLVRPTTKNPAASAPVIQTSPSPSLNTQSSSAPAGATSPDDGETANRDAWQATTDRLADIVGAVGSQQGEISRNGQELGQLLAQTRRTAIQFELRRGDNPRLVGPLSIQLKKSDSRSQRYTVCVYLDDKCVELKDRAVNEVVDFVLSADAPLLRFVATKVGGNNIAGYLEVPLAQSAH